MKVQNLKIISVHKLNISLVNVNVEFYIHNKVYELTLPIEITAKDLLDVNFHKNLKKCLMPKVVAYIDTNIYISKL